MTVPCTGDSRGDTSDIGDTGDVSWEKIQYACVHSSWLDGVVTEKMGAI